MSRTRQTPGLVIVGVLLVLLLGTPIMVQYPGDAFAYNSRQCGGGFLRWQGQEAEYDAQNGISETWWRDEIIYASGIWNNDGGADFLFQWDGSSTNDWYKAYWYGQSTVASSFLYDDGNCQMTEVNTGFNTWHNFDDCPTSCGSDTYDVRTVAAHEFGHWLVLDHVDWWRTWDYDCVMWENHGPDRTLCGHDQAGIQEIYGT